MVDGLDNRVTPSVAYFSMEVGLESGIPTYSGGLGVLAGDTLKAAADLGVPMVGISLVHRKGYFRQRLGPGGTQREEPAPWSPESDDRVEAMDPVVRIEIEGRAVHVRAWRYDVEGYYGFVVPVLLLDTELPENEPADRRITDHLYGGDLRYRLAQEAVLGLGGVELLTALGLDDLRSYHMNEGHSALLGLALLEVELAARGVGVSNGATIPRGSRSDEPLDDAAARATAILSGGAAHTGRPETDALEAVRRRCVFTTHTPVPAGHDKFPLATVRQVLGKERLDRLERFGLINDGELNMTFAALQLSRYLNGVAMRHREVSRGMFPGYMVGAITNGVHARTWIAPAFQDLYDRYMPEWRVDNFNLRYATGIPVAEIRQAHLDAKRALMAEVQRRTGRALDDAVFTIGFARRATPYKRADLVFSDVDRLRRIARNIGPVQLIFAGKAHPMDEGGKELIQRVNEAAAALGDAVPVIYLEDYDMTLGGLITTGVDLWLNTPRKPQEASGTSGMKAAMNGVPSLSVLDGWWIEGHVEGVTGWSIGSTPELEPESGEVASMYDKLERHILPMYYGRPDAYAAVMRSAIVLNGSFFHAERMVLQYALNPYGLPAHARPATPAWAELEAGSRAG